MREPSSVALVSIAVLVAGCTHDQRLAVRVADDVVRPGRAAVLITADGLDQTRLADLLATGMLPNIQRELIDRGVRVRYAVTCVPSITYANLVSMLTGRFPGHHGVLGNKWFDRYSLVLRDYTTIETYRLVDGDFLCPTIYEHLAEHVTVSVQCAARRGATRTIDNWATSGINWFFRGYAEVDKLVAMRFELIAELANRVGRWPVFIHAYFPGLDEVGHRYGADSPQYDRALTNLDRQVGRITTALRDAGVYEATYLVLVSDHGHVPIARDHVSPVVEWFTSRAGVRVCEAVPSTGGFGKRYEAASRCDLVLINSGYRRLAAHVRGPAGWHTRAAQGALEDLAGLTRRTQSHSVSSTLRAAAFMPRGPKTSEPGIPQATLWQQPGVGLVAVRLADGHVALVNRRGRAEVHRERDATGSRYRLGVLAGDPLGYLADPRVAQFVNAGWHESREWLAATADQAMPDLVPQIVEMFDSPRAGDIVVFAADGWAFSDKDHGGHGSVLARDMLVPLIFAGPEISPATSLPFARTVDIMPTLLELLGREPPPADGVSLAAELLSVRTAALP